MRVPKGLGCGKLNGLRRLCAAVLLTAIAVLSGAVAHAANTGTWTPNGTGGSATAGGVTVTVSGVVGAAATSQNLNATNYWTNPYGGGSAAGAPSLFINPTPYGSVQSITIGFNPPVDNPVIHVDRLGGAIGTSVSTTVWTLSSSTSTGGSVTQSLLANSNVVFDFNGTRFQRNPAPAATGGGECLPNNTATGCGSIQLTGTGISSVVFTIGWAGTSNTTTGDGIELAVSLPDPSLTLQKTVTNDNGGTLAATAVTLTATGPTSISGTMGTAAVTNAAVSPGTYVLSETNPAGYTAGTWSCTSGTLTGNSLVIAAGKSPTCTINNNDIQPKLTVSKISIGGIGSFTFGGTNGFASQTLVTTASGASVSGAQQILNSANTATRITETVPPDYAVTNIACTGTGAGNTTNNLASGFVDIATGGTAPGAVINCTFTNTKKPTLTLSKTVVNTGGGTFTTTNFPLTATGPTTITGISGATAVTNAVVSAGTYTLSEVTNANYTASAWSCTAGTLTGNSLVLANGQNATCSLTNTFFPAVIDAVNDDFSSSVIGGEAGGITPSVFGNDTLGGSTVTPTTVTTSISNNGGLTGAVINSNGTITVPSGTTSGTYSVQYQICSVVRPTLCDIATATVVVSIAPPSGQSSCSGTLVSVNGGFETPIVAPGTFSNKPNSQVPGWSSTEGVIEIWGAGFGGITRYEGVQLAELNAITAGTLTQTGSVHGRAELRVFWAHRARGAGPDTANMTLADNAGITSTFGNFTSPAANWVLRNTTIVAAPTASQFTMSFISVSSALGSGNGNFLDGVEACQTYLTLSKVVASRNDVDGNGADSAGDTIKYTFSITNPAGNARQVDPISIVDNKIGTFAVTVPLSGDTNPNGFLDPGETWIVQKDYTITAADMTAGSVINTAFVTGDTGSNTIRSDDVSVTATLVAAPKLTLTKTVVNTGGGIKAITDFPLTATGPVTITGVSGTATVTTASVRAGTYALTEPAVTDYTAGTWSCTAGTLSGANITLANGQTATCTITNTFVPAPALTLTKTAAPATVAAGALNTVVDGGDTIAYTYTVQNTGNVTLTNVVPDDAGPKFNNIAGTETLGAFSPTSATIAPGATQVFTATYALSQTDVNNAAGVINGVSNTATASGTTPLGGTVAAPGSTTTQTIPKTSALATIKSAGVPSVAAGAIATLSDAGDTVTYTYTVKNTGNVTLTGVVPADAGPKFNGIAGTGTLGVFSPTSATLAPNATQVFTSNYTLTQADVNTAAGITNGVSNTATASGTQPGGATTTSPSSSATTTIPKTSALTTAKSAATPTVNLGTTTAATDAGDTIEYSYTVTNTGNVTLSNVVPSDGGPKFNGLAGTGTLSAFTPASITLAPNSSQVFTATYTLSQADVNNAAGITNGVTNSATASGTQPGGTTTTSPPGNASTTIPESSTLTTAKVAGTPTVAAGVNTSATDAGDTITYTYTVKNTGNVSLFAVKPNDAGPSFNGVTGTGSLSAFTPATATLIPGAIQDFTATYTLTQADVNRAAGITGAVTNTATSSGTQPDGGTTTSPSSTANTTIPETSTLSVTKAAGTPTVALGASATLTGSGDTITYTYTVKNTGNVTLTGVVPTDAGPKFNNIAATGTLGAFTPAAASLAPNATQVFTAVYTLTQADVNNAAGVTAGVSNTAAAKGTQPDGGTTTAPDATATTTIPSAPSLTVAKTPGAVSVNLGATATATDGGDRISYVYVVKNTGNVTLTGVVPVDTGPTFNGAVGTGNLSAFSPASAVLLPGVTQIFTANYTLSQVDVNGAAGVTNGVSNTATAQGKSPDNTTITSPGSTATVTLPETSALTITKSASAPTTAAGTNPTLTDNNDKITYTYTVTNSGNVTLTNVKPTDAGPTFNGAAAINTLSAFSPASATLAPGATAIFTATYTLRRQDVNNAATITNGVSNTASASGNQPDGGTTTSATSTAKTTIGGGPALNIAKTANPAGISALPATITYSIVVTNTGNISLSGVLLTDNVSQGGTLALTSGPTLVSGDNDANNKIDDNEIWTYSATYAVTQANMNSGLNILNTATVRTNQTAPQSATASTSITQNSALAVDKSVQSVSLDNGLNNTVTDAGDTITFQYIVTNNGNVTLNNAVPVDTGPTFNGTAGTNTLSAFSPASATLVPGGSQTFTATYLLSQSDVNRAAGITDAVANSATATGSTPGGNTVTAPVDTATATLANTAAMTIIKTGTLNLGGNGRADAGDTISYGFTITNTGNTTLTGIAVTDVLPGVTVSGGPINLAPGASNSSAITATYTLTQDDIDAGQVVNFATANGKDPRNNTVSDSDNETISLPQLPSMSIDKTSPDTSFDAVGDVISYSYLVRNTGNTTISGPISVADDVIDAVVPATPVNCPAASPPGLAPNGTITCTARYAVTQADIDAGGVTNIASATDGTTSSPTDTVTVPSIKNPAMTMAKTAQNPVNFTAVGDLNTYKYVITNKGNTTITTPITVSDNFIPSVNCPALPLGGLKPTQSLTCTGSYTIKLDDLEIGSVTNVATATSGTLTTPPASATIPVNAQPALSITKSAGAPTTNLGADNAATDAGDKITYTYSVTNTGNVPLAKGISVTDDRIGTFSCFTGNLPQAPAAGSTQTCTATYTLTQADMDAATVTNSAFAKTTYGILVPPTPVTSPPKFVTVNLNAAPQLTVTKSAATLPVTAVNQVLTYTIAVSNTGNQTITSINVTDPLIPSLACTIATLAPGASDTSCVGTYTVKQADVDAGSLANTATASGNDPQGAPVIDTGSLTVPMPGALPSMLVTKSPSVTSFDSVGDVIGYTITVKNTGNVTLSDIKITDPLIPALATAPNCTIARLAPGSSSSTCSGTYTVTQVDLNNNGVPNTATASGKDPFNTTVTETGTASVPAVQSPAINVVKDGTLDNTVFAPSTRSDVGDEINYVFTVTNTGNVTLSNVKVTDPLIPALSCTIAELLPAATDNSCTGSYSLIQTDINAGSRANTATVKATAPLGLVDGVTDTGSNTETLSAAPALTLAKAGALNDAVVVPAGRADVGDEINYAFTVTNTGNQTLTNVKVTDPLIPALATAPACTIASLAPGDVDTSCTGTYVLTQADINSGSRTNTATASGSPPTGPPLTTSGSEIVPLPAAGTLSLVKTGTLNVGGNGRADAGDTVTYTFAVKNTGNVTLTNVKITDPLVTVSGGPILSLTPGVTDNSTFTANYTLTQADVNAGNRANTATALGTKPGGPADGVNTVDDETVALNAVPAVTISKAGLLDDAVVAPAGRADVGDVINYSFTVSNTGNVTLSNVKVTDPLIPSLACTVATLLPGDSDSSCTGSYTLSQTDVNAGSRANTATVKATAPGGPADAVTNTGSATVPLTSAPAMTLAKTGILDDALVAPAGRADAGDKINYIFTVTNTGNVTLSNVQITDPLIPSLACTVATLAPGDSDATCIGAYTLLQADVNAGSRANTATVKATAPGDAVDGVATTDDETVPLGVAPTLTLVKVGTLDNTVVAPPARSDVGDKINYAFTVTNTGNVTLSSVKVIDPLLPTLSCTIASLEPGAVNTSCIGSYALVQADVNAATRANTATVTGTPPSGPDATANATANVPLPAAASLTLAKVPTLDDTVVAPAGRPDVGDKITYAFTVTNTGNVTLTDVTVTDPLVAVSGAPIAALAPGATDSTTFTATYTITQADLNAGARPNTATVAGTPPTGPPITATGTANQPLAPQPSIALVKTATMNDGGDGRADAGDTISYAFAITNTGNVQLTNVTVSDPLATVSGGPITSLDAGVTDTTTFVATYTLTQADIDAGKVQNQATVSGTPPTGADVVDLSDEASPGSGTGKDDPTITTLVRSGVITVIKTAGVPTANRGLNTTLTDKDDTITYTFAVTNTGNVTLTTVGVSDTKVAVITCPATTLAPGASTDCTGIYTLVQADIDAGKVANQATAKGKPPTGAEVTDLSDESTPGNGTGNDDPTVTTLGQVTTISVVKTAATPTINKGSNATVTDIGDTIAYTFTVTNTGTVTLTSVGVLDTKVAAVTCPVSVLAPGTSTNCAGTYTLVLADMNAGKVTNQATASGTPPGGGTPVTDLSDEATPGSGTGNDDPTVTPIPQAGSIGIVKTATFNDESGDGSAQVGETITYTFSVRNTGNVTLTNVLVADATTTPSGGTIAVTGGPVSLDPGATDNTTFSAVYALAAADLTAGKITNSATATGKPSTGPDVADISDSNNPSDGPVAGSYASGAVSDDPTIQLLNPKPIVATNDTATGNYGSAGKPDVLNIFGNDTLGGAAATPATVSATISPATPLPPQLTFDPATGTVGVAAGAPAGTYTFDYTICELGNPTNCSTATVTVTTTVASIVATDNILAAPFDTKDALTNIVNVLDNDTFDGAAIDPAKVTLKPVGTLPPGITLNPDGTVDLAQYLASGTYTFDYEICEIANPANCATATVRIPVKKSVPAVSGTVFFDTNGNGVLDGGEQPQGGYIVKLLKNGVLVDQTTSANDGTYKIAGFAPGSGFQLVFVDPANGVAVGSIDNLTFANDTILTNQNQPIDPSGVFYNSVTGKPVSGVKVTMTTLSGVPLPAACLLQGQQNQVTGANGRYRFDIVGGGDPACPVGRTEYRLKIVSPAAYHPVPSTKYKPQPGAVDADNCPLDAVPGGACQLSADINQPSPDAPTPYYLAFVLGVGSPDIVNNHIPLDPILVLAPETFAKTANIGTVTRGQTVTYTISATKVLGQSNTIVDIIPLGFTYVDGSSSNNGKTTTPAIKGRNLTFTNLAPNSAKVISLRLKLVANAAVTTGTHTNTAQFLDPSTGSVLATATANVEVLPEHVFDCGEVVGKVFDDKNRNGYQDEGEPGLPGARVVTVKGLLITTDEHGRYHVACADVPDHDIGSNFILKLDTRSLPTGYRVTTENPRTVRLTRGKITKLNFGAAITRVVKLDLTDTVFASGSSVPGSHMIAVLDELVRVLGKEPSTLRITYYADQNTISLAQKRLANVEAELRKKWGQHSGRYELPIETRLVGKE